MMNENQLKEFANERFSKHQTVLSLWQILAENFYPERADFLFSHSAGEELADGLATSTPVLVRRELGDGIGAMLRDGVWFTIDIDGEPTHLGKQWLEFGGTRLFKLMNHKSTMLRRATKEGDHDYATFGNAVLSVELNKLRNGLLYRCWHLRDCAWWDNDEGGLGGVVRKWNAPLHKLKSYFGKEALHPKVQKDLDKKPFSELKCYHFDIPSDMYGHGEYEQFKYVSIFLDTVNNHIMDIRGKNHRTYVVPRFQTISGSPYAYSPATVVGLPDARTLQAMTHTLLEAGERLTRPPILAKEKVIRGDANLFPDGITYIGENYEGRLEDALAPLNQDARGFPAGIEMRDGIVDVLRAAFYTNKLNIPDFGRDITAYEFSERMKQFRRESLPLFSPLEHEYNGSLCELSFDIAMENNLIGSHYDIPPELRNEEVVFKFKSPLTEAEEEKKVVQFKEFSELLALAAEHDEAVKLNGDIDQAFRDAVEGTGSPQNWLVDKDEVVSNREALAQQQSAMMEAAQQQEVVNQ